MSDKMSDKKYCPFLLSKYPDPVALCKKEECEWWNSLPNISGCAIHTIAWLSYVLECKVF